MTVTVEVTVRIRNARKVGQSYGPIYIARGVARGISSSDAPL